MHAQRNFAARHRVGETEIGGGVVSRIAAENEQQVDFAAAHVRDEIFEGFGLVDRIRIDGIGVENGVPDIAQLQVHLVGQLVDGWRLMIADNDEAPPLASWQVSVCLSQHSLLLVVQSREVGLQELNAMYGPKGVLEIARPNSNPMVRLGSR